MKKTLFAVTLAIVIVACFGDAWGQAGSPAERRAFREYTSPQELVSIAPSTTLDKALAAISEVSKKFVGKVIVDTERRTMPIDVDIQGMQWRDALEAICRKNDLWYTEYENYIQITSTCDIRHRQRWPAAGPRAPSPATGMHEGGCHLQEPGGEDLGVLLRGEPVQDRRGRHQLDLHEEHQQCRRQSRASRRPTR